MLLALTFACSQQNQMSPQEMIEVSNRFHVKLEAAMPAKDLGAILDLYEEDAIYLPLSGPVMKGKEEIAKGYERTFSANVTSFDMERVELSGNSEILIEVGIINSTFQRDSVTIPGSFKYQNTYRKQSDWNYKIHRGIYNMNNN